MTTKVEPYEWNLFDIPGATQITNAQFNTIVAAGRVDVVLVDTSHANIDFDNAEVASATATEDHAVDAGDAAVAFAVPQPTVTRTAPDSHEVNAGDVAIAFDLPQPTVTRTAAASHAVAAGIAAMLFALPQPTVTRTVPDDHAVQAGDVAVAWYIPEPTTASTAPANHAVDAGDTNHVYDIPQAAVTRTAPDDHAVNAGDAAVAWAVPAPAVTHLRAHAVDAGDAAMAFAVPAPTVTRTGVLLVLTDFATAGLDVEFAALLVASGTENIYANSDRGGTDTPLDGELGVGTGETVISRIRRASAAVLTLNDNNNPVPIDLVDFFGVGGPGNDLTLWLQTTSGIQGIVVSSAINGAGGGFVNFDLPTAAQTLLDGISVGDRFIFAGTRPEPTTVDHAVNAGDANVAWALPQPTVARTAPDALAVAAGDANVAWAVTGPTVTRTAPGTHAVDAGDAALAFTVPQPTVTRTALVTTDHAVNAGDVSTAWAVPDPTVTHDALVSTDHEVDAGDASHAFSVPEPTVTKTDAPIDHEVNAGDVNILWNVPGIGFSGPEELGKLTFYVNGISRVAKKRNFRFTDRLANQATGEVVFQVPRSGLTGSWKPQHGQSFLCTSGTTVIFDGRLIAPRRSAIGLSHVEYRCALADHSVALDRRLVRDVYENMTLREIVKEIVTNYLNNEGLTTNGVEIGPTLKKVSFNQVTARVAFEKLSQLTGMAFWFIRKDLQFKELTATPGPNLTAANAYNFEAVEDVHTYGNSFTLIAGHDLTEPRTERLVGDGERRVFTLAFPVGVVPISITVDGVSKTVGINGVDQDDSRQFFWNKNSKEIIQSMTEPVLTDANVLSVRYRGLYPLSMRGDDEDEIERRAAIEGTSGRYERVERDASIDENDLASELVNALLQRYGRIGDKVTCQTQDFGYRPGQLISVSHPQIDVDELCIIEDVSGALLNPERIEYSLTLRQFT